MSRTKKNYLNLYNGCSCSQPKIFPANWDKAGASLKKNWYIWYRYYDPACNDPKYKDGKMCIVKGGVNEDHTLAERRQFIKALLEDEIRNLTENGWNPIRNYYMTPPVTVSSDYIIAPDTYLVVALQEVLKHMKCSDETKIDLQSVITHTTIAAKDQKISELAVSDIRRRHILMLLNQVEANKKEAYKRYKANPTKKVGRVFPWSNSAYNYYRSRLSMLFAKLFELEATELNPVEGIPKLQTVKKIRATLSDAERKQIDESLRKDNYEFWRLMHIFYHSGSRRAEIMKVKGKDVNLAEQKYKAIVLKGKQAREVERTITKAALPFWEQALVGCSPEDYVFSVGLKPGPVSICPRQVTRRWKRWVKGKYGIEADFYSLKHSNTTDTVDAIQDIINKAIGIAAKHNEHSAEVLKQHYDVNTDRKHDILKHSTKKFV